MPGNFPRSPGVKDLRTRRVFERLADQSTPGSAGFTIGSPISGGVAELLLYVDSSLNVAQTAYVRYHEDWLIFLSNGSPLLEDLADDEFAFSLETVVP